MGQAEIFQVLKKNKGKWVTTKDVARNLNRNRNSVISCIKRLLKLDNVVRRKKSNIEYEYSYNPNRNKGKKVSRE